MSSTQERHSIIERLMRISSTSDSSENLNNKYDKSKTHKLFVKRQWNDLNAFLTDNVNEVFQKLKSMEQEIWCKLILMQRNERVMKAYLRFPTININGGYEEFDGLQVGLARFTTPDTVISSTLTSIENLLFQLKEGIYIKIDNTSGDIYLKKHTPLRIVCASLFSANQTVELNSMYRKVFDLRSFKNKITTLIENGERNSKELSKYAFLMITIGTNRIPDNDIFKCDLWLSMVHIIAVEMIEAILIDHNIKQQASQRAQSRENVFNFIEATNNGIMKASFHKNFGNKIEKLSVNSDNSSKDNQCKEINFADSGKSSSDLSLENEIFDATYPLELKSINSICPIGNSESDASSTDGSNKTKLQRSAVARKIKTVNNRFSLSSNKLNDIEKNTTSSNSSGVSSIEPKKSVSMSNLLHINTSKSNVTPPPIMLYKYKLKSEDNSKLKRPLPACPKSTQLNPKIECNDSKIPISRRYNIKDDWICHQLMDLNKVKKTKSKSKLIEEVDFEPVNALTSILPKPSSKSSKKNSISMFPSEPIKRLAKWKSEKSLFF